MNPNASDKLSTEAIHAGHTIDLTYGAVSMPIILSTTFERGRMAPLSKAEMCMPEHPIPTDEPLRSN